MPTIPDDVLRHIYTLLDYSTLLNCRFLSRDSALPATALAFRHVRLETSGDVLPFIKISKSEHLRCWVREVTVDASRPPQAWQCSGSEEALLQHGLFILTLPRLRLFSRMLVLNVRLQLDLPERFPPPDNLVHETSALLPYQSLQSRILDTIFKCIIGRWTKLAQKNWQDYWLAWFDSRASLFQPEKVQRHRLVDVLEPMSFPDQSIPLTTLTLSNLPDIVEVDLHSSQIFQDFLNSQTLTALKILVAVREEDRLAVEPFLQPEKFDLFENFPSTWLAPPLASNLTNLSLYCHGYFGWAPKLDLRRVMAGHTHSCAFPNLRVLALGRYVLSHEWQITWIASLGAENGHGGLQELYLDDCPIIWRGRTRGPMDETIDTLGSLKLDNHGYPIRGMLTGESSLDNIWDMATKDFGLRWSTVLGRWAREMQFLRAFRMGSGDWSGENADLVAMARTKDLNVDINRTTTTYKAWKRRSYDTVHLNYDKPSLHECLQLNRGPPEDATSLLRHGV
ncbi:hypothetical protein M406DRAFT_105757, partial [Cryphonectria parasitica EP155]